MYISRNYYYTAITITNIVNIITKYIAYRMENWR